MPFYLKANCRRRRSYCISTISTFYICCWSACRPSMQQILERLKKVQASRVMESVKLGGGMNGCACVVS